MSDKTGNFLDNQFTYSSWR